jgi:hypothetical protein
VFGADPDYVRTMLTSSEPPQITVEPPTRGHVWRGLVGPLLASRPELVAVGDLRRVRDDADYAIVEIYLSTRDTPTDGGIDLAFVMDDDELVLVVRYPGGG